MKALGDIIKCHSQNCTLSYLIEAYVSLVVLD